MTDTTTAVPPTKLEQRARKATIATARVQLDLCKAAVTAGDFNAARAATALPLFYGTPES